MKNILSIKTLQATYGGDVMGGSVVPGMLGAFLHSRLHLRQSIRTSQDVAGDDQNMVKHSTTGLIGHSGQGLNEGMGNH